MRRILTYLGIPIAFGAVALTYLTATAATGDVACVYAGTESPTVLTPAAKIAIVGALAATAPTLVPSDLDQVDCWARVKSGAVVWRCSAHEATTLTDAQYRDLAVSGGLSSSEVAAHRKRYQATLDATAEAAWSAYTTEVIGIPLGALSAFRVWRDDPGDPGHIVMSYRDWRTKSPAGFRADNAAGIVDARKCLVVE